MAINIEGGGNVLVTQTLLCHLHVHALHKHDGGAEMSEVMETARGKVIFLLQLGEHLAKIFWIDGLTIWVNNDIVSYGIVLTQKQSVFCAFGLMVL